MASDGLMAARDEPADMTPSDDGDGLRGRVGQSVAWSTLNAGVLRLAQFLVGVVIARLVAPHDFGVFVVALTVYLIVTNATDFGVTQALIRERHRADEIGPTATTIMLTTSVVMAAMMFVAAPYLAGALGSGAATSAVRVIAFTIVVGAIGAVPAALLTRDFRQKERFFADSAFFLVGNGVLIAMALGGSGVMALAWSRVAGQLASTIILVLVGPKWYWPGFHWPEARRLLRFGIPLSGANFLWFSIDNLDFMVVGRMKGALPLGYYNLAYNISSWPVSIFRNVLNSVTLPTFAGVRDSRERLLEHLTVNLAALAAVSFPISALCLAVAGPLVDAVYGTRWGAAAPVLAILIVFGSIRGIIALFCDLLVAVGATRLLFLMQVLWFVVLLPAMIFGVWEGGIEGAAWAHVIVATVVVLPSYLIVFARRLKLRTAPLWRAITPPLLASVAAAGCARVVAGHLPGPWPALVVGSVTGLVVYVAVLSIWLRKLIVVLRGLYGRAAKPPASPAVPQGAGAGS